MALTVLGLVQSVDSLINLTGLVLKILGEVGTTFEDEKLRLELLLGLCGKLKRRAPTLSPEDSSRLRRATDRVQELLAMARKKAENDRFRYRVVYRRGINETLDKIDKIVNPCLVMLLLGPESVSNSCRAAPGGVVSRPVLAPLVSSAAILPICGPSSNNLNSGIIAAPADSVQSSSIAPPPLAVGCGSNATPPRIASDHHTLNGSTSSIDSHYHSVDGSTFNNTVHDSLITAPGLVISYSSLMYFVEKTDAGATLRPHLTAQGSRFRNFVRAQSFSCFPSLSVGSYSRRRG